MAGLSGITDIWKNVREVDLRPIRQEALKLVKIAIVGAPGSGRHALVSQMRQDPLRPMGEMQTPVMVLDLEGAKAALEADLVILLLNPTVQDLNQERELARTWSDNGKKVLVLVNQAGQGQGTQTLSAWVDWGQRRVLYGSVEDSQFLIDQLAPVVLELLPDQLISLSRHFPLFRVPVARQLINETSFSNAAYSISTGLAEIVPVFDIPLNVADMMVLTKSQAFLVYKLGLALGMSTRWQDYVAEFGSVLGGGFVWRQLARGLIGLIPAWGIIPKVGVAYSGTYVVGNVVLQWYLNGRHLSARQMQELYVQAFAHGKQVARGLINRLPRPRLPRPRLLLPRRKKPAQLPAEITIDVPAQDPMISQTEAIDLKNCPNCGRTSAADAMFCQYCGHHFSPSGSNGESQAAPDA